MHVSKRGATVAAAVLAVAVCAATLLGQAHNPAPGSLGELTAEIRQLRFAIEQSSRTQTQAQALGIFLSAQQSRITQVTARLDDARRELQEITQQSRAFANELAAIDAATARMAADPAERLALEDRSKSLKLELKSTAEQEQQARVHEADMMQAWQQEEARWNDLIARLQQIVEP